jgi:hypothetical protein
MSRLKKILDSRLAGVLCFLFAVGNRIIFTSLNSLIGTDTKIQLTYTQNLLDGKGIGVTKYFTSDLASPLYDTQQLFPPGFSLAIIPFLKLSGGNEYIAVLLFDLVVAVFFVIAVRQLAKKIELPRWLVNIITIIAGCFQFLFFSSWSSTDAISLSLVLLGMIETINTISKKEAISLFRMMCCGLLFSLPFFFRYMYLPIAILLPFLILISGFIYQNKNLKIAGSKFLAATISWLVIFFGFSLFASGNALFVQDFGRGVFFEQLTNWYPFLPASFINLDFAAQLMEKFSGITYTRVMSSIEIINYVLFVLLLVLLWRYLRKLKKKLTLSNHSLFIIIGSFISISIIGLLAYLTLTYKSLAWGYNNWTHSQHARYFAFIYIFIPLLFFTCLYHYRSSFKKPIAIFFVFIGLACMATETLHGVYYNIKIVSGHKDLALIRDADKGYRNFSSVIDDIKKKNPACEVIVSSPDQYYLHAASQMGYKAVFDYQNLERTDLIVRTKSILLMPVHQQEAVIMKSYIEKRKPMLLKEIAGTYFYIEEINPK